MGCTNLGTDSCFSLRNYRIGESYHINAFFHHTFCVLAGQTLVIEHYRNDGMYAGDDVKTSLSELLSVVCSGLFQMITESGILLEDIKHCHAGACDGRSQGVGEEVRTAPLTKQIYDLFAGAGESAAGSAEGFTEGTGDDIDSALYAAVLGSSASGLSYKTGCMAVVNHNQCMELVCQIADVTVAQCPIDGVQPVSGTDRYAQSDMEQSNFILYRMDSKTMKLTQVLSLPQESSVEYLGRAGETDYLLVYDRKTETYSLCSVHGDTVKTELTLTEAQQQAARTAYQSARGCIICTDETTGYKLTETGVEPFDMAAGICRLTDNGMTVTQNCTADETVLTAYNWNGQKTDSYTISNAYQSDDVEVRKHCAPRIIGSDGALLWGTAGLYRWGLLCCFLR